MMGASIAWGHLSFALSVDMDPLTRIGLSALSVNPDRTVRGLVMVRSLR